MGKSLHSITNWSQYNKSLIYRGSLTFWVDAAAMNNWFHHDHHGRRGRNQRYTDQTICTFLMLKGIFSLNLRATQGLLDSLFELMNVPLYAPDYIDGRPGLPSPQSMKMSQVEIAAIDPDFDRGYRLYP
jgi:hypothetical protein